MNQIGYGLFQAGERTKAIAVLDYATKSFPQSANAQDSLAEVLEADGQHSLALKATERSLALLDADPSLNEQRKQRLRKALTARLDRLGK